MGDYFVTFLIPLLPHPHSTFKSIVDSMHMRFSSPTGRSSQR